MRLKILATSSISISGVLVVNSIKLLIELWIDPDKITCMHTCGHLWHMLFYLFILINGGYEKGPLWEPVDFTIASESDIIALKCYEILIE